MTATNPTPAELCAAAAEREPVFARDAAIGMLLSHKVDGENVGVKIRHVEPSDDETKVLVVLAGGATQWYTVDEEMPVVDPADARAAEDRLRARRRKAKAATDLRTLADLIDKSDLPLSATLRIQGSVDTLEELTALSEALGTEEPRNTSAAHWVVEHYFGANDKYSNPVELSVGFYDREKAPSANGVGR